MSDHDEHDPLDDLPQDSRADVIASLVAVLASDADDEDEPIDERTVEDVLRSSEPLWNALEELGLVDSWGGMEFVGLFPEVVAFILQRVNSA